MWVLTGDKPETAVNIGYACRLLEEEDLVINMSCENKVRRPLSASLEVNLVDPELLFLTARCEMINVSDAFLTIRLQLELVLVNQT